MKSMASWIHPLDKPRTFKVCTAEELIGHYKKCLYIKIRKWNETTPTAMSIEYTGKTRRYFVKHWRDLIKCSKCGLQPMKGSYIEKHYIVLLNEMNIVIYPLEILTFKYFST